MRWLGLLMLVVCAGCSGGGTDLVTLYAAQDQEYVAPILKKFTKETGVKVEVVYDNEVVKTVGMANRLLAERRHPQCDVFWNNEEMRTRQLGAEGVFRQSNGWASFGARTRKLVINTNLVAARDVPKSLLELTNSLWKGKVSLAYPLFGSTATHFLALRQTWGEAGWERWCRALAENKPYLLDGNSMVVRHVAKGESWIGLTDSDDIAAGQREGLPVKPIAFRESMSMPNSVAVTRDAPHPENAERLFVFLQSAPVTELLQRASALERGEPANEGVPVDWGKLLGELRVGTAELEQIFLR